MTDFLEGDYVVRKGERCQVVHVDRSLRPWAYTVRLQDGREVATEADRLTPAGAAHAAPAVSSSQLGAFASPRAYWLTLIVLIVLTVADGVLVTILFDEYTEYYAQFVNQGTAFVYVCWAALILLVRRCRRGRRGGGGVDSAGDKILRDPLLTDGGGGGSSSKPRGRDYAPWYFLVLIGVLNGSGNFCMAIGQPHTPGLTQTLLSLLTVPLVMVLAWACLKQRPSAQALAGALLIVVGTAMSGLRVVLGSGAATAQPIDPLWYSIALYAFAQIFLSSERVFEEHSFGKYKKLDPMVMFLWTLATQFTIGWALYPLQTVPAFGGIRLDDIPSVIGGGILCAFGQNPANGTSSHGHSPAPPRPPYYPNGTAGNGTAGNGTAGGNGTIPGGGGGGGGALPPHCGAGHALIFWIYCSIDFWCYFAGLYVIQKGGANLMVISSAVALPLQQLVLCTPFLVSVWAETFFWGDAVALVLVLVGFLTYQLSTDGVLKLPSWLTSERCAARRGE